MVGRLIQEQDIRLGEQQAGERHAAALTSGDDRNRSVSGRAAQGVHSLLQAAVQRPGIAAIQGLLNLRLLSDQGIEIGIRLAKASIDLVVLCQQIQGGLNGLFNHLPDGLGRIELRLLLQ